MSRQMVAEANIRSAHAALEEGRREEAKTQLEAAALTDIPEQHLRAAQLFLRLGEPEHAVAEIRKALADDPYSAPAWSVLGHALLEQGDEDEAGRALRRAVELDPSLSQPHASLGTLAAKRGDYTAAAAAFARSLERDPDQPMVARMQGMAEVCAAIPSEPLPSKDLEHLLLTAAEAGFPSCVREWIAGRPWDGLDKRITEAYLRAERAAREKNAKDPR